MRITKDDIELMKGSLVTIENTYQGVIQRLFQIEMRIDDLRNAVDDINEFIMEMDDD